MESVTVSLINLIGENCSRPLKELGMSFEAFQDMETACIQLLISKILGISVVLMCLVLKIPQILSIYNAKSAKGMSAISLSLEMTGYTVLVIFGLQTNLPFSTYGEVTFLVVQDMIIMYLLLKYNQSFGSKAFFLIALYSAFFISGLAGLIPLDFIRFLHSCSLILGASSKITQIRLNFKNQSTGTLSLLTVGFQTYGTYVRVLTTIWEVKNPWLLLNFICSSTLNTTIASQIIYYRYFGKEPTKSKVE